MMMEESALESLPLQEQLEQNEQLQQLRKRQSNRRSPLMKRYRKPYIKAAIRATLFISAALIFCVYSVVQSSFSTTTTTAAIVSAEPSAPLQDPSISSSLRMTMEVQGQQQIHILSNNDSQTLNVAQHRRLQEAGGTAMGGSPPLSEQAEEDECSGMTKADPEWFAAIYFIGVLYTFLAIAIVCDELFVPALEEIASEAHMNLSMDVAGATLMAAGGSAPELFTSIFGTFVQESEVGIGTVVGSAVFNVLFVIAMCALFTKEVLALTWWPLFRDSLYYSFGLVMLGLFVGVISPSQIELWEAIVLFVMYLGYVTIMYFNQRLYRSITSAASKVKRKKDATPPPPPSTNGLGKMENGTSHEDTPSTISNAHNNGTSNSVDGTSHNNHNANGSVSDNDSFVVGDSASHGGTGVAMLSHSNRSSSSAGNSRRSMRRGPSLRSLDGSIGFRGEAASMKSIQEDESLTDLTPWPGTFRSGVLKILRNPESWKETAGIGIVAVMAGDVHHVFRQVDVDDSGDIDKEELEHLFAKLECTVPAEELDRVMEELDENNDGKITEEDFVKWYVHSEKRISMRTQLVFDFFDTDNEGKITRSNLKKLLKTVEPTVTDDDVEHAMSAMYQTGSKDEISYDEFSNWYVHSMIYQKRTKKIEEDMEVLMDSVFPPEIEEGTGCLGCLFAYLKYLVVLPIVAVLAFTVPDVRKPGCSKYCYVSFFLSIIWIGVFSYYMVDWAEIIGHTIGIPSVIMGLTLLAAGTSVPDLLTSVIVARMGEGDMALSSSIGSNIFDILVGLPIPWIAYTAWKQKPIEIGSDNVWVYIFTLLGMLVFVVVTTHFQGWKLTKTLASLMLMFYAGFLALAIMLELPFKCT